MGGVTPLGIALVVLAPLALALQMPGRLDVHGTQVVLHVWNHGGTRTLTPDASACEARARAHVQSALGVHCRVERLISRP